MRVHPLLFVITLALVAHDPAVAQDRQPTPAEWSEDLDVLVEKIETIHPMPFTRISRGEFHAEVEAIRADLATMSSYETALRLMALVALIRDGHSNLHPADPLGFDLWYPIRFYAFSDGIYVTAAGEVYADLAGAKVLRIGSIPAEQAHAGVIPYMGADNSMGQLEATYFLSNARILHTLGIAPRLDVIELEVVTRDGDHRSVSVSSMESKYDLEWRFWGEMFGPPGISYVTAFDRPSMALLDPAKNADLPRHLRARRAWWYEYLPDQNAIYMQMNHVGRTSHQTEQTFEELYRKMFALVDDRQVDRFVLDIRYNSGGNGAILDPFVHEFICRTGTINRPGHLYVLIGRKTFSAAIMLQNYMERHTEAIFVGEPSGAPFNSFGDHVRIHLPNSGMGGHISSLYWQLGRWDDKRRIVGVPFPAVPSGVEYFGGRDVALELALAEEPPRSIPDVLAHEGAEAALRTYESQEAEWGEYEWWSPFEEREFNAFCYRLLRDGRIEDAVAGFELNTRRYPDSWNVWDSLGDAHLEAGNYQKSLHCYRKALSIDPDNSNATAQKEAIARLTTDP